MSLSSRRKKSYEDKLRQFQNRNIFAGIVLAVAVGFAIWLMVTVLGGNTPRIYLSTNYINYSGTQKEIPFAVESCERVVDSFESEFKYLESEKPLELDSNTTQLQLSKQIRDKDVLIVYLNGHLVPGKDKPVEYLPAGNYEGSEERGDFETLLKNINDSKGKLKILLIDAGRFTRSPVFPARDPNDFQKPLADAIARNEYGLDDNFWIIVSHSKDEFSRVSTPLKSSLFSEAVAASIEYFADEQVSDLSVLDFFSEIRNRSTSWSRNLKNKGTQHPILMYPGKGRVLEDRELEVGQIGSIVEEEEKFRWKVAATDRPEEEPEGRKVEKDPGVKFDHRQSGAQAAERLVQEYRYDASPRETVASLERFLEIGEPIEVDVDERKEYASNLSKKPDRSQGKIIVDDSKLKPKQIAVQKFRRALLGVTVLARFQNELRHWQDDKVLRDLGDFKFELPELRDPISDSELTDSESAPVEYTRFTMAFDDFYRQHGRLFDRVKSRIEAAKGELQTPTQAEMIGRISERYLPIIAAFKPSDESDNADEEKKTVNTEDTEDAISFELDLVPNESKGRFDEDMEELYDSSTGAFGSSFEFRNDTALRFRLAAQGLEGVTAAENLNNFQVVVPNIRWTPLEPGVEFQLDSNATSARVNPTDPEPIKIRIDAEAIGSVDLVIAPEDSGQADGLQYSFVKESALREKQVQFNGLRESKLVEVWLSNRDFDGPNVTIPFKLTAAWEGDGKDEFKFDVTLTKGADLVLVASRKLGEGISQQRLLRWGRQHFPTESRPFPLKVKSLANIETGFDLSIQNKSPKVRNLSFELYSIRDVERKVAGLRPDRADGFRELSGWLAREVGTKQLPGEFQEFQLLATTKRIAISANDEVRLDFMRAEPNKDDEAEPVFGLQEISHCLLLVGTDVESKKKEWFQWIGFEPEMPADYSASMSNDENLLRPLGDISAAIKISKEELKRRLGVSWPKEVPVAKLAVVSPKTGRKPTSQPELSLDGVFSGERLRPENVRGSEQRILIMELFGVPAYRVLRQSSDAVVRFTDRDLVGLRVNTKDSGCICYPKTWSLLNFDASGKEQQTVFMRSDSASEGNGQLGFEFLLPSVRGDALSSDPADYMLKWNGGEEMRLFPNSRKHFIQIGEDGISFKSEIKSHVRNVPFGNIADESTLEVFRKGRESPIGSWQFKTEPFGDRPTLSITKNKESVGNLEGVKVTADISMVRSPVEFSSVKLLVNGKEIEQFKNQFSKGSLEGKYKFNLGDLAESVELGVGSHRFKLAVSDFFGETLYSEMRTVEVEEPKKQMVIVPKVKPKVIFEVRLNFPGFNIDSFESLTMEGKLIPWNTGQQNGTVAVRSRGGYLKVFRIPEGKYNLSVTAKIPDNEKIANNPPKTVIFKKTVEVNKERQIFELEAAR